MPTPALFRCNVSGPIPMAERHGETVPQCRKQAAAEADETRPVTVPAPSAFPRPTNGRLWRICAIAVRSGEGPLTETEAVVRGCPGLAPRRCLLRSGTTPWQAA